jgi:hypothetical protein
MSDRDILDQAYAAQLQQLFNTLFAAHVAGDDIATAESHYAQGVVLLRQVRERALALISA